MAQFSISDLKKHLGPGLGLRKNKYLLEIPLPGIDGAKINVLARSAGLPERNITTSQVFHKGRVYTVRGETDYVGTYEVSIADDSEMNIRKKFDDWLKLIDDTNSLKHTFSGGSYEKDVSSFLDNVKSGVNSANQLKNNINNINNIANNFTQDGFALGSSSAQDIQGTNNFNNITKYQTDINIWQLSATGNKIYGYKLQNAFPSQIGIVTLDDGDDNTISEFSLTFSFSEFIPLEGISPSTQVQRTLLGGTAQDIISGIETFVR